MPNTTWRARCTPRAPISNESLPPRSEDRLCGHSILALGRATWPVRLRAVAPENPLLDTSLQVIEFLRDASHVRNNRISEWRDMHRAAGFMEPSVQSWKTPIDFTTWIARIGTPPARIAALESVFPALPRKARASLLGLLHGTCSASSLNGYLLVSATAQNLALAVAHA